MAWDSQERRRLVCALEYEGAKNSMHIHIQIDSLAFNQVKHVCCILCKFCSFLL